MMWLEMCQVEKESEIRGAVGGVRRDTAFGISCVVIYNAFFSGIGTSSMPFFDLTHEKHG